jgi:hypothetical protein
VLTLDTSGGGLLTLRGPIQGATWDHGEDGELVLRERGPGVFEFEVPKGKSKLAIAYGGTVFDAVQKKDDLSWVVGDATTGIVSEKGVYLTDASGWYPRTPEAGLARFDVKAYVPEPFLVVTQGGVPTRSTEDLDLAVDGKPIKAKFAVCEAHAVMPTDGCDLVAGPFVVKSEAVEGIEVSTYFLPGEADAAPLWLKAAGDVVRRYESILGTYPHPKFDVVENFFQTGYGMPSFTLLGDEVVRYVTAGAKHTGTIPPGYLDHEYVHGWFGNGLFVDPKDGNWCEALTTYFSNYLAKELESPVAGRDHRRGVLEHYAIRVEPEDDYPVREFRTKTEDKDNDVGYGKGSLVFHALRKRLGDEAFFARVRSVCDARVGTYVSWTDWLRVLDGEWARPYLERKGLPAIRIASATAWPIEYANQPQWEVRVEVVVDQPRGEAPWPAVDVPVSFDDEPLGTVHLEGRSGVFRRILRLVPLSVEIDPGYDVLRRIADDDLPWCLNRSLATGGVVTWSAGAEAAFRPTAEKIAAEKRFRIESPPVGGPGGARKARDALVEFAVSSSYRCPSEGTPLVSVTPKAITVNGLEHAGEDLSILFSPPATPGGGPETRFVAQTEAAAARARYVTFYGWDQFVVFKAGQRTPVARGFLDRQPKATRGTLRQADGAAHVESVVQRLASDEFAGRRAGTPKQEDLAKTLVEWLSAAAPRGVETVVRPFGLGVADLLSSRDLVLVTDQGRETLKDAFRPLYLSREREAGTPVPFGGAGARVVSLDDASPEALRDALAGASDAAVPVLVAPSPKARGALAPLLDAPNALTPEAAAEAAKPGRDGRPRRPDQAAPAIAARRSRAWPGATVLERPVLVLEDSAVARLAAKPAVTAIDFGVEFGPERATWARRQGGRNVVSVWPAAAGDRGAERPPMVVVSAHYDSWGLPSRGADDNASGVACVLEALRGLPEALAEAKARTGVIVCLFDGEEWGLQGSRALAKTIAKDYDVRAVVNVDAVGRVRDDTVHVIGLSTVPELAGKAKEALAKEGLKVGRDIDAFGYREGSDHWPFHESGVPAITLWASDYATMDSVEDVPEKVDPVGVARIAKALRALVVRLASEAR